MRNAWMRLRPSLFAAVLLVTTASAAFGQTAVRVTKDQAIIWRPGFSAPATVVKAGTELRVVSRQGNWYEVAVPFPDTVGAIGFIAVSQVESIGAVRPVDPAAPVIPQRPGQPVSARRSSALKTKARYRAYAIAEGERMSATKSFHAVLGKSTLTSIGFGVEADGLSNGGFVRFALTHTSNRGTRVFVDSSQNVYSLHVPLTVRVTPVEIGGGWRFSPRGSAAPYLGVALLLQRYQETSSLAGTDEDIDVTDKGSTLFGGVGIGIKFARIAVEGQYRAIFKPTPVAGVFQQLAEKNLGGAVFRLSLGIGF